MKTKTEYTYLPMLMAAASNKFNPAFPPLRPMNTGYQMRHPTFNEYSYFGKNPDVAGMATEDMSVVFNPSWEKTANPLQKQGLYMLESARNYMKEDDSWKSMSLTDEQKKYFKSLNDPYYSKLGNETKQTLISRIIGGDEIPGVKYTNEQMEIADKIRKKMMAYKPDTR